MAVAVIPVAVGQAGVSASADSGVSAPSATGAGAGIVPHGTMAAAGGSAPQRWQQLLQQAGVRQTNSAEDGQSAKADPTPNAQQVSGATPPVAFTLSLPKAASLHDGSKTDSSGNNQENSNLPSTSRAAQVKTKNAEPVQKKDVSASASAQNLLASLWLPAAATVPLPLVPASTLAKAAPDANRLTDRMDPAVAATLTPERANGSSTIADSAAPGHGQGIAAPVQAGLPSGTQVSGLLSNCDAVGTGLAASTDSSASLASEPFSLNALHAHAADAAPSATGTGIFTPPENATTLAHVLDVNASQGANAAQAASQAPDAYAASPNSSRSGSASVPAHAERNRDASLNTSLVPGAQNASYPAQLSALHAQPVAAAHAGVPGSPGNPGSPTLEAATASGAHAANPFATLDSAAPAGPATWIHAATRSAEAGFQDPSLGWVGVRAETTVAGAIHASVLPGSSDAAQALSGHLAGLHAYLSDHHSSVGAVTLARPESAASWSGFSQQQGQNQNHRQGQQGSSPDRNPGVDSASGSSHYSASSVGQSNFSTAPAVSLPSNAHKSGEDVSQTAETSHAVLRSGGLISVIA